MDNKTFSNVFDKSIDQSKEEETTIQKASQKEGGINMDAPQTM